MLVGQPPFLAQTPLETQMKVTEEILHQTLLDSDLKDKQYSILKLE